LKIEKSKLNLTLEQFEEDSLIVDATLRNLEVLGEAAGKVSIELKNAFPTIPWRQMSDLRNVVIHEYFGVDLTTIWQIIKIELPKVMKAVKNINIP
jgi:uncharacterized protein with HEPN domain